MTIAPGSQPSFHPGRCAQLVVGGDVVGYAGELHPRVCAAWELPERSCAFELNLDAVIAHGTAHVPVGPSVHTYPVAKEDVALVVDETTPANVVQSALVQGAGELLEEVRLFDVFRGAQLGEGKKSLAFALRFRAPDRTLEVAEVAAARTSAISRAQEVCGAQLRG